MNEANLTLSPKEQDLVNNADWILTKNTILQKAKQLLAITQGLELDFIQSHPSSFLQAYNKVSPKISKGENYRGLPYLILDYPRYFQLEHIFAIRCMFWWGHFFSITLHLSGDPKNNAAEKVIAAYEALREKGFYCCVLDDPWEHHFETDNYRPLALMDPTQFAKTIRERPFIKLAQRHPLDKWESIPRILSGDFMFLVELLS